MARLTVFVLFSIICSVCFSKGGSGEYFISGQALSEDNTPLGNVKIAMTFNGKTTNIETDANGNYKLAIKWVTPCRSVLNSKREYKKALKELNPKWIYLNCNGQKIQIENQYKKYRNLFPESEAQITRILNLKFDNDSKK